LWNGRIVRACAVVLALLSFGCQRTPASISEPPPEDHTAQVQQWRDKHEADYRREWVTISGLHFLDDGSHTIGSGAGSDIVIDAALPARVGTLTVQAGRVRLEPAAGVTVTQKGQAVTGSIVMKDPAGPAAPEIAVGDVRFVIHSTGDRLALRVRDPNGAPAKEFRGFAWFPIAASYRIVGRFIRDAEPRKLQVMNTFDALDTYSSEGVLEFSLWGQILRLRPFTTRPKRFYIVFRDASSGAETYAVARFLYADLRDDGTAVLDFNQAYNPPCAFNKYTTCPLPLKENILPVKILAGERAYGAPQQ
jgi:uncharacterized protein (DUF1684 family)